MALMAQRLQAYGPRCIRQLRVDGIVCQIPRKEQPGFLALNEETWPCGLRKYKAEQLPRDSRTIALYLRRPPPGVGGWEHLSQSEAEAHMRQPASIYIQGQGGVGKTYATAYDLLALES